jgi:endonuclease/exonuclease/phosphatase (EEP) superfamily protein YafD
MPAGLDRRRLASGAALQNATDFAVGRDVRKIIWLPILLLAVPAMAIAWGGARWPFELAYHFVAHLAVLSAALAGIYLALRRYLAAATALLFLVTYGGTLAATGGLAWVHAGAGPAAAAEPGFDLVSFNLLADQEDPGAMLAWLSGAPADVLVLVESSEAWRRGFETLRPVYPYQALGLPLDQPAQTEDPELTRMSGVAILSRLPLRAARALYPAGRVKPALAAEINVDGTWTTVVAVHTTKPLTRQGLATRDRYLDGLAQALKPVQGPLVVAGDFNATRYTPRFRNFTSALELDAPPGQPATFPARSQNLGLAIDHVLVRGAAVTHLDAVPPRGSDHRGLLARIAIPAGPILARIP